MPVQLLICCTIDLTDQMDACVLILLFIVAIISPSCCVFLNSVSLLLRNMLFDLFKFFMRSDTSYFFILNRKATYSYDTLLLLAILTIYSR